MDPIKREVLTEDAKVLMEAGYLDASYASLTSAGQAAINALVIRLHGKELVKNAKEIIAAKKAVK